MDRSLRPKKLSDHRQPLPGWSSETELLGGDIKLRVKHSPRLNLDTRCLQIKTIDPGRPGLAVAPIAPQLNSQLQRPIQSHGFGQSPAPFELKFWPIPITQQTEGNGPVLPELPKATA